VLRDAKVVLVRPIRPEDRDELWPAMTAGVVTADIDLDAASCGIAASRVAW
jgi:hypothetical protein